MEETYPQALGGDVDAGAASCDEPVASASDGHHRPGEACLGCHSGGDGAPHFTVAGTLYTDLAGTAAIADAAVHIVDAAGNDTVLRTAANGNFWSTEPFEFPVTTYASLCPGTSPMLSQLDPSGGDCNKGGCHAEGFRAAIP